MRQLLVLLGIFAALAFTSCKQNEDTPTIDIEQDRDNDQITGDDYVYHLPVIFHVFYQDSKDDSTQYISHARLKKILDNVNELWAGNVYGTSADMNVKFELAECDENGNRLSTPGVEYIKWTGSYPISHTEFMNDNSRKYWKYLWEPNEYINVMLYNFKPDDENKTIYLGISNMPLKANGYPDIEGLSTVKRANINKNNLKYAYCVSINSLFASDKYDSSRYTIDKGKPIASNGPYDINVTLAHELGHYLGLCHVFCGESEDDSTDLYEDTDYCDDTPSYNRQAYLLTLAAYLKQHGDKPLSAKDDLPIMALRSNPSETWTAVNILDYYYTYGYLFTTQQRERVRQVLYYSPLIPGPKKSTTSRAQIEEASDEPMDLPQVVIE